MWPSLVGIGKMYFSSQRVHIARLNGNPSDPKEDEANTIHLLPLS